MRSVLELPAHREFQQMCANEGLSETHIPLQFLPVLRLNLKQTRASRVCVVALLNNGEVLTWGERAQTLLVHRLHDAETVSTNQDGDFQVRTAGGEPVSWEPLIGPLWSDSGQG